MWRLSGNGRLPRTVQRFGASCSISSCGKRLCDFSAMAILLRVTPRGILPRRSSAGNRRRERSGKVGLDHESVAAALVGLSRDQRAGREPADEDVTAGIDGDAGWKIVAGAA